MLSSGGIFNEVNQGDKEIKDAFVIKGGLNPVLYDLSTIQAYRADELRPPADSFLVVDTTFGTYSKVTED